MKTRILSLAIALVSILCIGIVYANNAKWTKGPSLKNNTISGMATGLGTGPYDMQITGYYDCVNNGKKTPGSANWSKLDVTIPIDPQQTGGNFKISEVIPNQCDHANWTFKTCNLQVALYQNGKKILGPTNVEGSDICN